MFFRELGEYLVDFHWRPDFEVYFATTWSHHVYFGVSDGQVNPVVDGIILQGVFPKG